MGEEMNENIKDLAEHCDFYVGNEHSNESHEEKQRLWTEKFAELIVRDMANELFVVYPGGKNGGDVAFQNISIRSWIKQVYGVEE